MSRSIIAIAFAGIIGILIGFFSHDGIMNISSKKNSELAVISSSGFTLQAALLPDQTAPVTDVDAQIKEAHNLTVNFRQHRSSDGFKVDYCTNPGDLNVSVPKSSLGFTELSYGLTKELLATMDTIRGIMRPNAPDQFRIIYGLKIVSPPNPATPPEPKLIVVPLFNDGSGSLVEKTEWRNTGQTVNVSTLRVLEYKPDCPIVCDYSNSKVILKNHSTDASPNALVTTNACRTY